MPERDPATGQFVEGNSGGPGAPCKYEEIGPDNVDAIVLKLAGEGASESEWAAELEIARQTIYYWRDNIPRFSTVFTRAKALEQAWWERTGRQSLTADKFNSAIWSKTISGRFRADYTERQEVTGPDGGPIETKELSDNDYARRTAFLLQRARREGAGAAQEADASEDG